MQINETNLSFTSRLSKRSATAYIVLHHRAGDGDIAGIHKSHLGLGWAGCGYHLYVRKDGSVWAGRPLDTVGAHCTGKNSISVSICFEGNFEREEMPAPQVSAGMEAVSLLKEKYPAAAVVRHSDLGATLCPGKNFPFEKIKNGQKGTEQNSVQVLESANDIAWVIMQKIEILEPANFVAALDKAKQENSPLYWGYYKLVNKK